MNSLNVVPQKSGNLAWRIIDGEAIAIVLKDSPKDKESIHLFNSTATRIWELIDGRRPLQSIFKKLLDEYGVGTATLTPQLKKIIAQMANKRLITLKEKVK